MRKKNYLISIVIPVHNESENLRWHHAQVNDYISKHDRKYEIIYVDDGSVDDSLKIIKSLARGHSNVHYVAFSRNFGKEAATSAGLKKATGDAVVMIDADGQHPVELIDTFLDEWQADADVVIGVRKSNTDEGYVKRFGSHAFYRLLYLASRDTDSVPGSTDFRLLDRVVVDEYNSLTERNRVTRNLIDWLGFERVLVPFAAPARHAGTASYSYRKLFKLALNGVISHSTRPLKVIGLLGIFISTISVIGGVGLVIEKYILGDPLNLAVTGVAILALFLSFMIGIVLVCQGLLALYLENVHNETQNRPLYVVKEQS
jgi:glycosyltransferase involved in cell wall biosynthesis